MKNLLLIDIVAIGIEAVAGLVELPRTEKPRYLDMESSTNVAVAAFSDVREGMTLTMECDTAMNNAMRIYFGRDDDKDGKLKFHEVAIVVGWDAGEWVFEEFRTGEGVKCKPCGESKRRKLTLAWTLGSDGKVASLIAKEGDTVLSDALAKKLKSVFDKGWNMIWIVRNGMTDPNERISLEAR